MSWVVLIFLQQLVELIGRLVVGWKTGCWLVSFGSWLVGWLVEGHIFNSIHSSFVNFM